MLKHSKRFLDSMGKHHLSDLLKKVIDESLEQLIGLWEEIGFPEEQLDERCNSVVRHVENLFEEMVQQEASVRDGLVSKIKDIGEKLKVLSKELSLPLYQPDPKLKILQCRKDLHLKLEALTKQKHTRMVALKKLLDQEQVLCDRLKAKTYPISSNCVPSDDQLWELEKHIETLQAEQEKRFATFIIIREQVQEVMKEIDTTASTAFERQALVEDESQFILSSENMSALTDLQVEVNDRKIKAEEKMQSMKNRLNLLWNRLETPDQTREEFLADKVSLTQDTFTALTEEITRLEALKHSQMEKVCVSMKRELERWWDVCFIPKVQRDECKSYKTEGVFTDAVVDALETEIGRLQSFYQRHESLYSQVKQWEQLLEEFTVLEKKANDPNRYNNRGGALLQEEKTRKRIMKDLPKLEANLEELIKKWEEEQNLKFVIYGMAFSDYVVKRYEQIKEEKEREKEQRHKTRALQIETEMKYGSKPNATPKKRGRMPGTPSMLITNKTRRLMTGTRTPLSATRVNNTNINMISSKSATPRRRSGRLRPWERKADRTSQMLHKTLKGGIQKDSSLTSTGSYKEFAKILNSVERSHCRSSIIDHQPSHFTPKSKHVGSGTSHVPTRTTMSTRL